jgi:hypothetical protein
LIWAAIFIVNALLIVFAFENAYWFAYSLQLLVTAGVLIHDVMQPSGHGVVSRRINRKNIDRYLSGEI